MATTKEKGAKAPKDKKPKKTKTGKERHVVMTNKTLSETIDVKLYQLDAEKAAPFMRDGQFSFRLAFDGQDKNKRWRRFHKSRCPLISVTADEVLQTENETAQRMIEQFSVPQKTERNGEKRPAGKFFKDVTATETEYHVDLDEIFDKAATA
jgi:hypothetical protein